MYFLNRFIIITYSDPVVIKKIASGTAADESGQLRVGDNLLEVKNDFLLCFVLSFVMHQSGVCLPSLKKSPGI